MCINTTKVVCGSLSESFLKTKKSPSATVISKTIKFLLKMTKTDGCLNEKFVLTG